MRCSWPVHRCRNPRTAATGHASTGGWRSRCRRYLSAMSDVVALATELLSLDSTTGRERDAVDFVARWLVAREWNVTLQEVEPGRSNVWATRRGGGVTLSTHLDTV